MKRNVYRLLAIVLAVICLVPAIAYTNSAEPPALVVIMENAPPDAAVALVTQQGLVEVSKSQTAWETYFVFYHQDIGTGGEIILKVSGNGTSYEQTVEKQYLSGYPSVVTMDFSAQTIAAGKLFLRSILLVSMRVLFTLASESLVFFLFGFREKRSWIIFLVMNLCTQGMLNIVLNGGSPLGGQLMYQLIMMEFLIFVMETVTVLALIKEHGRLRRIAFVLTANLLSLIWGGFLIAVLPV